MNDERLHSLFTAIDAMDAEGFAGFLAPDCRFRFANMPEVSGREPIRQAVDGFFASIAAVSHKLAATWSADGRAVCHGEVSYTRHDGSMLSVPFANIFRLDGDLIAEYLIFADISALYGQE